MEKFTRVNKVKGYATQQSRKLSEKTLHKTQVVSLFFVQVATVFLFIHVLIKETFSRDFEFKEFFRQCFQIGYKSLPLVSFLLFFSQAFSSVGFIDFLPAVVKSVFFGAAIGLVGTYQGYNAGRGTESVGIAANTAVVQASLLIILIDLIAVQITDLMIL